MNNILRKLLIIASSLLVLSAALFISLTIIDQKEWALPISIICVVLSHLFNIIRINLIEMRM